MNVMLLFRKSLGLILSALLLLQSLPSHALKKLSKVDLEGNGIKAKALSDSLFDGSQIPTGPAGVLIAWNDTPPSECQQDPSKCETRQERHWDSQRYHEADDFWREQNRKCQAANKPGCAGDPPQSLDFYGTKTQWELKSEPQPAQQGPHSPSSDYSSDSHDKSPGSSQGTADPCAFWGIFSPEECARKRSEDNKQWCEDNPKACQEAKEKRLQKEQERDGTYNSLSSAGKFGFWSTIVLSLALFTGGAALAGYFGALAAGLTTAQLAATTIGAGLGGLLLGLIPAYLSYNSPGSFHEALGTTILSPLALSYGVLSGLVSILTFGFVSPSWGNPESQRGSKVLHRLHKASKTAAQITTLLGGVSLGVGALGVPGLATASALIGTPLAATAGIYTGTSALIQTGRLGYMKFIKEPRDKRDKELYQEIEQINQENKALDSKIENLKREFAYFGIKDKDPSLQQPQSPHLPQSWDKLSSDQKLSYHKGIRSYQDQMLKTIKQFETKLEPYRRHKLAQELQSKRQTLQEYQSYFQENDKNTQDFLARIDKAAVNRQSSTLEDILQLNSQVDKLIQKQAERYRQSQESNRRKYLSKQSLNQEDKNNRNEALAALKRDFGNNFWQNSQIVRSLEPQNKQDVKSLDLRYDFSLGPFDKEGKPLLGALYETAVSYDTLKNQITNTAKVQEPPFIIPSKTLHIIESPQGNPRLPSAPNVDGTTHGGLDIGSLWGPKEGFGLPVGLRFETLVVGARKQIKEGAEAGYGKHAMVLNLATFRPEINKREFWILAHAGEHDEELTKEERQKLSGVLVEPGEFVAAYHPIIILGQSGNAYTAGKRRTPQPQLHIEKIVVTNRKYVEDIDNLMNKAFEIQFEIERLQNKTSQAEISEEARQKIEKKLTELEKLREGAWSQVHQQAIKWRDEKLKNKPLDPLEGYR